MESPGWDLLLSVLPAAAGAFWASLVRAGRGKAGFRPLRWAMGALPLNPAIFREKSSKAFFVLVRFSPLLQSFQRCALFPQAICPGGLPFMGTSHQNECFALCEAVQQVQPAPLEDVLPERQGQK